MSKPKTLVFDDEAEWARIFAKTLESKFTVSRTTIPKAWSKAMASTYFDVIVVDVQILGSARTGAEIAENAILEYGITSPIIIVSGNVNLKKIEDTYDGIFFDYISKDESSSELLISAWRAYEDIAKGNHLVRMLTELARKHNVFNDKIIPEFVREYGQFGSLFDGSIENKTVGSLIQSLSGNGKQRLAKAGKIILDIIYNQK